MADFIRAAITFVLSNFPLTFFVIGVLVSLVAIAWSPAPLDAATIVEKLISWHVFFALGVTYLYNFVFHVFFGKMAAAFIGWADSPFQFEVGMASLGFSAVAFTAAFRSFDLRLAAILGSSLFLLGAAAGHVYQMVTERNSRPAMPASSSTWTSSFRWSGSYCSGCSVVTDVRCRALFRPGSGHRRAMQPTLGPGC